MEVRIVRKFAAADDICGFELAREDGAALPAFTAGAHIDVHLDGGIVRQYSLCNSPAETHRYVIGVLREPASRGGSVAMHALAEGSVLRISEPKNHFPLSEGATRSLLFAGGIGITPILGMAERLAALDAPFELHYCTREPARAAFRDRLAEPRFAGCAHLYFDSAPVSERIDLAATLAAAAPGTHLYVCGPAGFIAVVLDTARAAGWSEAQLHREYFAAAAQDHAAASGAFQVKLAASGRIVEVDHDETVIAALTAAGVDVPTSCEQGVCGTCLTRVLEGEPDHRDVYLTDDERAANDCFLPCCSRSKSPLLVLDL
ncbi:PDR/VanB family oxidoreductase [Paraburkholderia phosphatilytica]|uniref:PDR/VanB family oxidoreductase n=1 Tax=Paraburkholderia phosphatilytica TaxID=2282883 RepID=UPI000E5088CD|nr:PDR/VanB family oxidoreductase [Paraburkholderia phosphatilytica]